MVGKLGKTLFTHCLNPWFIHEWVQLKFYPWFQPVKYPPLIQTLIQNLGTTIILIFPKPFYIPFYSPLREKLGI